MARMWPALFVVARAFVWQAGSVPIEALLHSFPRYQHLSIHSSVHSLPASMEEFLAALNLWEWHYLHGASDGSGERKRQRRRAQAAAAQHFFPPNFASPNTWLGLVVSVLYSSLQYISSLPGALPHGSCSKNKWRKLHSKIEVYHCQINWGFKSWKVQTQIDTGSLRIWQWSKKEKGNSSQIKELLHLDQSHILLKNLEKFEFEFMKNGVMVSDFGSWTRMRFRAWLWAMQEEFG